MKRLIVEKLFDVNGFPGVVANLSRIYECGTDGKRVEAYELNALPEAPPICFYTCSEGRKDCPKLDEIIREDSRKGKIMASYIFNRTDAIEE